MATKIEVKSLSAMFTKAEVTQINLAITAIVDTTMRGAEKWQYIVGLYHDGKTANVDRKRSLSAAFRVACEAKGITPESSKVMFSSGTMKAEVALGYRTMPTPGPNAGKGKGKKGAQTGKDGATTGATGADGSGVAYTVEVCTMAREIAERAVSLQGNMAGFTASYKISAQATKGFGDLMEELGKLSALIGGLNVKLGNVETK